MFTWICPQCGREVPPAYTDCPDCTQKAAAANPVQATPQPPAPERVPEAPVVTVAPPPAYPPPIASPMASQQADPGYSQPASQAPAGPMFGQSYSAPPPSRGLPTWLLTIVFTFAFLGLGAGIYWTVGYLKSRGTPTPSIAVESPAAKPGAKTSPLQKYIEIAGVRFTEDAKKKLSVKFLIVNHSGAEIGELAGNVTVWGRTQKSEEEGAGSFSFKTSLGPYEYKELVVPLSTKLKAYELPDWQNVSTDLQITVPAASGGSAELH